MNKKKETRGPKKKLGRPRAVNPSQKDWEIIELLAFGNGLSVIAREYKVSRQWIFQIKARWKDKIDLIRQQAQTVDALELERRYHQ